MATKRINLTVTLRNEQLNAETLLKNIREVLCALAGNDEGLSAWEIHKLTMQSPLVITTSNQGIYGGLARYVRHVDAHRDDNVQSRWKPTENDVVRTERLRSALNNGIAAIDVKLDRAPTPHRLTASAIEREAERILGQNIVRRAEAEGEVEGNLDQTGVNELGKRLFRIRDRLTKRAIECLCEDDKVFLAVKDALPARVIVTGRIRYNAAGEPTSVKASKIRVMPSRVLHLADISPMDITGGDNAYEYVRRLRGG